MSGDRPASIRAFIALALPAEVREAVLGMQRDLNSALRAKAIRWTPPDQIHLTLRFLGNVAPDAVGALEAALGRSCSGVVPFELAAQGVGAFADAARPRVLWVGLGGQLESLRQLHSQVVRETEAWGERENRDFHPHLTLGRIQDARQNGLRAIALAISRTQAARLGRWRVERVQLMRSELSSAGAIHTCLATLPLPGQMPA